jgi:hypothetical protein
VSASVGFLADTSLALVTGRGLPGRTVWEGCKRVWIWNLKDQAGRSIPGGEQPKIWLVSDTDAYPAYDCDVQDINVVGREIWAAKRL